MWNAEDRLTESVTPEGERWRYAYDPLGRRISKEHLADDGSVDDHTYFSWDGSCLLEQRTRAGHVTTWHYGPGTHRPLAQTNHRSLIRAPGKSLLSQLAEESTGHDTRFHAVVTDHLGTPTELVGLDGELTWQQRTVPWGTRFPAPTDVTAVDCPLRFPGQYADEERGRWSC